jgi:molybdopterin biosynthesis enzyme
MDVQDTQRIARLTPLADVLACIDAQVAPVAPRSVAPAAAVGRCAAGDVTAAACPARPLALRDGWAVEAALTHDASPYAPAPLRRAVRIETGAPLPPGTDAVAEPDAVVVRAGSCEAIAAMVAGEGVLQPGTDADAQTVLLRAGQKVSAAAAAALAGAQVARLAVREPRLRIVRGRSEPDSIIDAAVAMVTRSIEAAGALALGDAVPGDLDRALRQPSADAVIAIGGTGAGRNDASVATLARLGRVEVHGVALTPGESAAFGSAQARPVLLLPGRIDAALAAWLLLGERLLARLAASREEARGLEARLSRKVASRLGLAELVPVRLRGHEAEPMGAGYLPLQMIAQSDGWILIAAEREGHPAGASVVVRPWV